jgi:hypothetical protein
VHTPPILQFPEHDFDLVPVAIAQFAMRDMDFPVWFRWDAGFDTLVCEGLAELVGIVRPVGQQNIAVGSDDRRAAAPGKSLVR